MVKIFRLLVIILAIITVFITIIFLVIVWKNFTFIGSGAVSWEHTSQVSDFFGGVIGTFLSAMGFILIYLSFNSQTESQNDQKNQFLQSQIETRFIELIKIHKETVANLTYDREITLQGQKVIDFIVGQFESSFVEVAAFFTSLESEQCYKPTVLQTINGILSLRTISPILLAQIDIAYSIVFFGMAKDDIESLRHLLKRHYNDDLIDEILEFIKLKSLGKENLSKWKIILESGLTRENINSTIAEYRQNGTIARRQFDAAYQDAFETLLKKESSDKYYGGHQYKLGHYFRHLFLTVKYINDQSIIGYKDKYNYIKILRAQISTIEQYLIFYNSLSFMGRAWELEHVNTTSDEAIKNKWLFTKYNFIKNTPNLSQLGVIKLDEFYPDLQFEFTGQPEKRAELGQLFK